MKKFDTPAPIAAVLDLSLGSVRFVASDRTDTTVEVAPTDSSRGRDVKRAEQTTVEYVDGVLRIDSSAPKAQIGNPGSVEVTVALPAGSTVEAKVASAEFRGTGRLGEVTFEGAHGLVELDETASARLRIAAGDISVGRLGGPAEITTVKGDIRVAEATRGTVELRTQAGGISVGAANGVSASLDAGTLYGRISNSLKNAKGADAELAIHATTSYGDITAASL
jgi:DUF4097 and DUF4098 domain-containing protein YvlB